MYKEVEVRSQWRAPAKPAATDWKAGLTNEAFIAKILREDHESFLYSGVPANVSVAINSILADTSTDAEEAWRPDLVRALIKRLIRAGSIFQNPRYRETLNEIYQRYPRIARIESNEKLIVAAALEDNVPFDFEHLNDLVAFSPIWNQFAEAPEYLAQKKRDEGRAQKIAELTAVKPGPHGSMTRHFSVRNNRYDERGVVIQFASGGARRSPQADQGFKGMSDEDLSALYEEFKNEQRLKNMTPEQLRAEAKRDHQQHIIDKYHGDPLTQASKATRALPTANTIPALLIDPRDGKTPITRRAQLIEYINSGRYAFAKLVQDAQGITNPERAAAAERLLNSKE